MSNPSSSKLIVAMCASALLSAAVTAGVLSAGHRSAGPSAWLANGDVAQPAPLPVEGRTPRDPSLPEAASIVVPLAGLEEVATF